MGASGGEAITAAWVAERLPARPRLAHKGSFGRVLVVGGSLDFPGAPVLAALGAMRIGAGVVRIAAAESVASRMAGALPEATWMVLDEESPGLIAPGGWRRLTAEAGEYGALVIGPGLGRQPATLRRVRSLVGTLTRPAVVDADALTALSAVARWWNGVGAPLVLTPHPGEFERLTGEPAPAADHDAERAATATAAAERWGQVVVLKGARTVVADGTRALISQVATPALATAGSGDVLAGAIAGLLAGGSDALDAAACAVAVHAAAGMLAEERIGRGGATAGDIAGLLPHAADALRSPSA